MATKTRVSLDEFLAMPETEPPSELVDGEIVQKMAANFVHGLITSHLIAELQDHLRQSGEGVVVNEVRYAERSEERVYLPDINVVLREHVPTDPVVLRRGPVEIVPDFVIEVLSPGESAGRTLERADFFMRSGVPLAWFVDPETETVAVYRPGRPPEVHRPPETLDAAPVLQSFRLDLAAVFDLPGD